MRQIGKMCVCVCVCESWPSDVKWMMHRGKRLTAHFHSALTPSALFPALPRHTQRTHKEGRNGATSKHKIQKSKTMGIDHFTAAMNFFLDLALQKKQTRALFSFGVKRLDPL